MLMAKGGLVMKKRARVLFAKCLVPSLIGFTAIPTVLPVEPVVAMASEPISLSYTQIDAVTGKIEVTLGVDTVRVLLPNGSSTTDNITYQVTDNGTYDFVAYDTKGRPTQHHITVSGLDVDHAPLTTAHGLYVKLNVSAFDTLSQVDAYRYKLDSGDTWSTWIPYKDENNQEVLIPITNKTDSFIEELTVQVEVRDYAGNIASTESTLRVDHYFPEIEPYNETIYTNSGNIFLPLVTKSYFKNPDKLIIKEGNKTEFVDLTNVNHEDILLSQRPDFIKADWGKKIPYTIEKVEGNREIELTVIKTYEDFKGNVVELASSNNSAGRHTINVVFDTEKPIGTITIQTDAEDEVFSSDVNLDLTFSDKGSGIKKIRVFETDNPYKEYFLTPEEIEKGSVTIPWSFGSGETGQVSMEITDRAGNITTVHSNVVKISKIQVTGFKLTKVVNPAGAYSDGETITNLPEEGLDWVFNGNNVRMVSGGNFEFDIGYNIGTADPNRFNVESAYKITMVHDGVVVYESSDLKSLEQYFKTGGGGFKGTFHIPSEYAPGKTFKDGTEVWLYAELSRIDSENPDAPVPKATFGNLGTRGQFIGVIGHYGGLSSIEQMIRFNEKY